VVNSHTKNIQPMTYLLQFFPVAGLTEVYRRTSSSCRLLSQSWSPHGSQPSILGFVLRERRCL